MYKSKNPFSLYSLRIFYECSLLNKPPKLYTVNLRTIYVSIYIRARTHTYNTSVCVSAYVCVYYILMYISENIVHMLYVFHNIFKLFSTECEYGNTPYVTVYASGVRDSYEFTTQ